MEVQSRTGTDKVLTGQIEFLCTKHEKSETDVMLTKLSCIINAV